MSDVTANGGNAPPLVAARSLGRALEYFAVGSAALVAEIALFARLIQEEMNFASWLTGHGAVSVALGFWYFVRRREGTGQRAAVLLVLSVVALGPFGAPGALLAAAAHRWFRRHATPFEDWYKALFPEPEQKPARDLYDMIVSGRDIAKESGVASFTDILATGSTEQKRATITLMARFFRPAFAPALKRALADPEPAIRVQAATAASEIESGFQERAEKLSAAVKATPENPASHLAMARHFDDYAFSGLLDPEREDDNRNLALESYLRCLDLDADNLDARAAIGRLLLRKGEYHEAATVLGEAVVSRQATPAMLDFYLEALFKLGNYQRIRAVIRDHDAEIQNDPKRTPEVKFAVDLWAGRGGAS